MTMDIYEDKVCPTCRIHTGMNYQLSKGSDVLVCPNNSEHRFRQGKDGFLQSVK